MRIHQYSASQICVVRDNGSIIMRTITDDTESGWRSLGRWIERYKERKRCRDNERMDKSQTAGSEQETGE